MFDIVRFRLKLLLDLLRVRLDEEGGVAVWSDAGGLEGIEVRRLPPGLGEGVGAVSITSGGFVTATEVGQDGGRSCCR